MEPKKNILFFGDSLTAGYGLISPETDSFPALLARKAKLENLEFFYINAGISGDTTTTALQRLPSLLDQKFDIAVICIGANDMLQGHDPRVMNANIEKIIEKIRVSDHKTKIILLGMELPAWIVHQRASVYRDIYKNLAKKHKLLFFPFLLEGVIGNRLLNLPDLIHPNTAGYRIIADNIWPLLRAQIG